jgi:hypothetical protein
LKAETLGWIAVAVAPRDRAEACGLIDEALALCVDCRDRADFHSGVDASLLAAFVAMQAQQIGYPDIGSVVARVLAARTWTEEEDSPADRLPVLLGPIDPVAAGQLLAARLSRTNVGAGSSAASNYALGDWIFISEKSFTDLIEQPLGAAELDPGDDERLGLAATLLILRPEDRLSYYSQTLLESELFADEIVLPW